MAMSPDESVRLQQLEREFDLAWESGDADTCARVANSAEFHELVAAQSADLAAGKKHGFLSALAVAQANFRVTVALLQVHTLRRKQLEERIEKLETRPDTRHRGIWRPEYHYREGNTVTHHGAMFYCCADVSGAEPGDGNYWQLCEKREARNE